MNSFNRDNLNQIKHIFEERTGVKLAARKSLRRPVYVGAALAVIACCFTITGYAMGMFSSLSGDDLSLNATYEGEGVVSIFVENKSDKDLNFQPSLKLMLWNSGEEIPPTSDRVVFEGTRIAARSSGTMTVDLSDAYDIQRLEEPLVEDNYYFILTNNDFVFGQDWMCSVEFAEPITAPLPAPASPIQADAGIMEEIEVSLRPYFETITYDIDQRNALNQEYIKSYSKLFAEFDGNIVPSVAPLSVSVADPPKGVIFDSSIPPGEQFQLIGSHWFGNDANFKMLATDQETAYTLSAWLPSKKYKDAGTYVPLLYIFVYEKGAVDLKRDYAFIYGQLKPFTELEPYKVYEDDQYLCFEVSGLVYSDLREYVRSFVSQNPDISFGQQEEELVESIYRYYKENLGKLIYKR